MYATRVLPGESIAQVVARELPEVIGSAVHEITGVYEKDTAKDKLGNLLPRMSVHIKVPFFQLQNATLSHPMFWSEGV